MTLAGKEKGAAGSASGRAFLERLYLDRFDRGRFGGLDYPGEDPEAERIVSRYREIISEFPPSKLEKEGRIPEELFKGLKEIGLFGLNIPRRYGGEGLSLAGYLSVLQALAGTDMALAITPTAHLSIGLKGILLFGTEEQREKYLTRAATGEMIFAYALTEPGTGSDAKHIQTRAVASEDGSHYILNGSKTYITNGGFAGGLTVFAQMDPDRPGFMGAFIVETDWDGVQVGPEIPKMGLKISSTVPIALKDVKVPAQNLLGEPGDGFKIAMTILNYGRLGLGAGSTGAMEQSLRDMFKRATSREQFGQPIRNFELIQEKMVKAAAHAFACDCMTRTTAALLEADPTAPMAMESSHVKLYGTTRAWDTLYDALQTAGGSGYLASGPYEKRMRDFRVTTVFEGTTEIHSIYPALYMLRNLGKEIRSMGRVRQAVALLRKAYTNPRLDLAWGEPAMDRAVRLASRLSRKVRKMVCLGLLRHGKEIAGKEFLLRRITSLSLAAYGLLSCLAALDDARKGGREIGTRLNLLEYLTEEAEEVLAVSGRLAGSGIERAHRRVYADIVSALDAGETGAEGGSSDE